jgi:hypothetical protein
MSATNQEARRESEEKRRRQVEWAARRDLQVFARVNRRLGGEPSDESADCDIETEQDRIAVADERRARADNGSLVNMLFDDEDPSASLFDRRPRPSA